MFVYNKWRIERGSKTGEEDEKRENLVNKKNLSASQCPSLYTPSFSFFLSFHLSPITSPSAKVHVMEIRRCLCGCFSPLHMMEQAPCAPVAAAAPCAEAKKLLMDDCKRPPAPSPPPPAPPRLPRLRAPLGDSRTRSRSTHKEPEEDTRPTQYLLPRTFRT